MKNENTFDMDNSILTTYLREVEKVPLLSREEEYELAVRAKKGDLEARNRLAEANSRFVISIAKKFQGHGLPLIDLISEGNIGLLVAIDKFEPEKGFHFISYAVWWIRQSIMKALADKSRMVRLPVNRIDQADEYAINVTSLDTPVGDEDSTLGDFIESSDEGPDEQVLAKALTESIDRILSSFTEKEREIITLRYGLHDHKPMSLKEIGDLYGLTKERIRQIEKRVLSNLLSNSDVQDLKSYVA